jgi:hypothetical protein
LICYQIKLTYILKERLPETKKSENKHGKSKEELQLGQVYLNWVLHTKDENRWHL